MQQDERPLSILRHMVYPDDETGYTLLFLECAANLKEYQEGQVQFLRLAMTSQQARQIADELRVAAGQSRQVDDPGHA